MAFAVKEWLLEHDWNVIAFNPPGAQGTFSIPNPEKSPRYRGQTGTTAPDIIAVKADHVVIAECKDFGKSKVLRDVDKLYGLISNNERMGLFDRLVSGMCAANGIEHSDRLHRIIAVGYGGDLLITEVAGASLDARKNLKLPHGSDTQSFHIEVTDPGRDTSVMGGKTDPASTINATLYPTDCDIKDILLCGGTGDAQAG